MAYTRTTWVDNTAPYITAANLNNIEAGIVAASTGTAEWVVRVDDYGAVGDGVIDDSAAIIAARDVVLNSRVSNKPTRPVLQFGPKTYKIVSPDALFPANTTLTYGYTIRGVHQDLTNIQFSPTAGSSSLTDMNLITATGSSSHLYGLVIEDIGFTATNANASFAYLFSTQTAWVQNTTLRRVSFAGDWKRIIGLDGDSNANLNSEMVFDHISLDINSDFSDAFLRSGITTPGTNTQQDQFLNYWFNDCMMEYNTGDLLVFDKGGHIHVNRGSFINSGGTFFKMGDYSHFASTMWLSVDGVRFELRSNTARVIDCAWRSGGHVSFRNCDDESSAFNYQINGTGGGTANFDTHIYRTPNNTGPIVRYEDCGLMGYHRVVTTSTVPDKFKIIYDGCRFYNMQTGRVALLSAATSEFLRYDSAAPAYRFVDCRDTLDVDSVTGSWGPLWFPTYKAASYYFCNSPANPTTNASLGNGSLRLSPWVVTKPLTITRIGAEFTAAGDAASVFRIGVYADDGTGLPTGAPVLDAGSISTGTGNAGTVATGGTPGAYEITLGTALSLQPGVYWVGGAVQGVTTTQPTMRTSTASSMVLPLPRSAIPIANDGNYAYVLTGVTGALGSWSGSTMGGAAVRIFFKSQ